MKKMFCISGSASVIILLVLFYLNIAGGKSDNANNNPGNIIFSENTAEQTGAETTFSPRSGGWQLQVMPNMGNRLVRDLYFTDSLTGYAVASPESVLDSSHILKTTNGGNNWTIKATYVGNLPRITFINANTGFAGGNYLLKTTNAGENWMVWNWGPDRIIYDMQVFSEDTIWYADRFQIGGGAYRTTNGGINWEKRDNGIPANSYPFYIYFYNSRIGFSTGGTNVYKTTDAGLSWSLAFTGGAQKLYFRDSLNGYRASQGFFRTSDGGINWSKDSLPNIQGNTYTLKNIMNFDCINNDTIYCTGGAVYYYSNGLYKTTIYKTTNGGINWGYQIPDTSYRILQLNVISNFQSKIWAVDNFNNRLIYSSTGGDSTTYVGVNNISSETSGNYVLFQNYPNPFNQLTVINYQLPIRTDVKISIYNVSGKEVSVIVEKNQNEGNYELRFNAENLGSGVYFYQLIADEKVIQTKKMILLK
ncbi:MAG: T9SS type A sorting domain-containing protein [Ignavibacteria bacterium]|nr:T9SS type A sorting domain-containing protein [Ignavibacteria bacterium]